MSHIKQFFTTDFTYKQMTKQYTTIDGILALCLYIILILSYYSAGVLVANNGIYLGELISIVLIAICVTFVLLRKQKLSTIGFTKKNFVKSLVLGMVAGLLALLFFAIPLILEKKPFVNATIILYRIFYYFLIIGLSEEIFFRGYIQPRIYSLIKSDILATIVGALLFYLMHFPFQGAARGTNIIEFMSINWSSWLMSFFWHFVLNFLYRKYNSIVAPTILHGFLNLSASIFI